MHSLTHVCGLVVQLAVGKDEADVVKALASTRVVISLKPRLDKAQVHWLLYNVKVILTNRQTNNVVLLYLREVQFPKSYIVLLPAETTTTSQHIDEPDFFGTQVSCYGSIGKRIIMQQCQSLCTVEDVKWYMSGTLAKCEHKEILVTCSVLEWGDISHLHNTMVLSFKQVLNYTLQKCITRVGLPPGTKTRHLQCHLSSEFQQAFPSCSKQEQCFFFSHKYHTSEPWWPTSHHNTTCGYSSMWAEVLACNIIPYFS